MNWRVTALKHIALLAAPCALLGWAASQHFWGVRPVVTHSIDAYVVMPARDQGPLRVGDLVLLCPQGPVASYLLTNKSGSIRGLDSRPREGACPLFDSKGRKVGEVDPFVKPVAALPGHKVLIAQDGVHIDGVLQPNSVPQMTDRKGNALPVLRASFEVKEGEVFVLSTFHPGSIDGRYMGAVPASALRGKYERLL